MKEDVMRSDELQRVFQDRLHRPGDPGYEEARLTWRRDLDPRPALIAEARDPAEVRAAIGFAREQGLPFAVQATGHGTVAACDGGLVLKTGAMASVEVGGDRQVARVGAGALWGAVVDAAAPHGLAPLSGSSPTVGVTGYTLGGGTGWLSRKYGYAADNVVRAEVVTAEGDLLNVSADEHPDLFWALRGGGGSFGVVTAMELRLFPVTQVYAGMAMYAFERAPQVLECYREWALSEPDESNTAVLLVRMPDSPPMLALRVCHLGDPETAEAGLAPLTEAAGPALIGGFQRMPYAGTSNIMPAPPPSAIANRLDLYQDLPDPVLAALPAALDAGVTAVELRHWGGRMARPPAGAGPVGHRTVPFSITLATPYASPGQAGAAHEGVAAAAAPLTPYMTGGTFLNFLFDPASIATAYTRSDFDRLREIKKMYDPDAFFRTGHSIPPAA
jgi:FAD binding domain-containing protein/berberine-like enzyme